MKWSFTERYEVWPDDSRGNGQRFIDMNPDKGPGVPDGMKVDQKGSAYCTGFGGVSILSPEGRRIGTILTTELPANPALGDLDPKTLCFAARTGLDRTQLKIPGMSAPEVG